MVHGCSWGPCRMALAATGRMAGPLMVGYGDGGSPKECEGDILERRHQSGLAWFKDVWHLVGQGPAQPPWKSDKPVRCGPSADLRGKGLWQPAVRQSRLCVFRFQAPIHFSAYKIANTRHALFRKIAVAGMNYGYLADLQAPSPPMRSSA